MRVGIVSDTHNQVELTRIMVEYLRSFDISYLLHAGDVGEEVFKFLSNLDLITIAVYGNNDLPFNNSSSNLILKSEPYYFKIGEKTFKLMHHPFYLSSDAEIIVYGHLHKFECQRANSLFLNPGEVCAREKPKSEAALLDLKDLTLHYCYLDLETTQFIKEKVC
ncbi:MAG: metallophosphoesterase family protein [Epsilonproteobacteria bacterium]|nr:metallophosphoesterase family protein [Campylobacterota bacterium]